MLRVQRRGSVLFPLVLAALCAGCEMLEEEKEPELKGVQGTWNVETVDGQGLVTGGVPISGHLGYFVKNGDLVFSAMTKGTVVATVNVVTPTLPTPTTETQWALGSFTFVPEDRYSGEVTMTFTGGTVRAAVYRLPSIGSDHMTLAHGVKVDIETHQVMLGLTHWR